MQGCSLNAESALASKSLKMIIELGVQRKNRPNAIVLEAMREVSRQMP